MARTKLDQLKRKPVEIRANGFTYRGVLLEATETEVTLKGTKGYITIPMDRITSVIDPKSPLHKADAKYVDTSFWNADLTQPETEAPATPESPEPSNPEPEDKS